LIAFIVYSDYVVTSVNVAYVVVLMLLLIVRFTMYTRWEFMEICKPIHFWKAYNARSPKNNVYVCAAPLDPGCLGNENLGISTQN